MAAGWVCAGKLSTQRENASKGEVPASEIVPSRNQPINRMRFSNQSICRMIAATDLSKLALFLLRFTVTSCAVTMKCAT